MLITPFPQVGLRFAIMLSAQLWLMTAHAHPVVMVRGTAQLTVGVDSAAPGDFVSIRGRLRDELGEPIASAPLQFKVTRPNHPGSALSDLSSCAAQSLGGDPTRRATIETDADGQFCAQVPRRAWTAGSSIHVDFGGADLYAPISSAVTIDDARGGLLVDCDGLGRTVSLDDASWSFAVTARPMTPTGLRDTPALSLQLLLRSSQTGVEDRALQRIQTVLGVPTQVRIDTSKLGAPGLADLWIVFDGSPDYKPSRDQFRIEKTTNVRLKVLGWPDSITVGSRFSVTVVAESGVGLPPSGQVEVTGFDGGTTLLPLLPSPSVVASLATPRNMVRDFVTVKYQPNAPGWRAPSQLQLSARLLPQSRWQLAAWAAAALLIIVWFAWSRRKAEPGQAARQPTISPRPYAHVEVIETANDPHADWSGKVVDAHEGQVVGGAVIEVRRPGFVGLETLFTATTNEDGMFRLTNPSLDGLSNCRLDIRAVGYAKLELPLPKPGTIKVHLVSARRAVLDRLVSWVKRRGQPFDSKLEPTPDWLAEVARAKGHPEIEAWAKAVSRAAFGMYPPENPEGAELVPPPRAVRPRSEVKRNPPERNG